MRYGERNISPYLTTDECNKCFFLVGTPPGSFSQLTNELATGLQHSDIVYQVQERDRRGRG